MDSLQLKIITPEKIFYSGNINMVVVRTIGGDLAVMKNKSPVMAVLKAGTAKIFENSSKKTAEIDKGYVFVYENNVDVVTKAARWTEEASES